MIILMVRVALGKWVTHLGWVGCPANKAVDWMHLQFSEMLHHRITTSSNYLSSLVT